MSHRNARLTPRGRRLLVERVRVQGMPVAHVAKAMGVSRQCAHRWVKRFDEEGVGGLEDRSSRPRRSPSATDPRTVAQVLKKRRELSGRSRAALDRGAPGPRTHDLEDPAPTRGAQDRRVRPDHRRGDPRLAGDRAFATSANVPASSSTST